MTRRRPGRGFSLLEVIVTLVIASVVAGLAVVGYKTLAGSAVSMSTSAALDRAVVIERTHAVAHDGYTADIVVLNAKSPDLKWVTTEATGLDGDATVISVAVESGRVGLAALDGEGVCQARVLEPTAADGTENAVAVSTCTGSAALR